VQYVPQLLPYNKERIDEQRHLHGHYLLTASQNLLTMEQITESLSGYELCDHRDIDARLCFRQTSTGAEVDIVVETEGRLVPIEVKLLATPQPAMAAGTLAFRDAYGEGAAPGYVVHPGNIRLSLAPGVTAIPFAEL